MFVDSIQFHLNLSMHLETRKPSCLPPKLYSIQQPYNSTYNTIEIAIRPAVPKAAWPISGYVSRPGSLSKQERKSNPV
uniref:Uncharacterized protein n=1 Tax=Medicago truncatula TaxID=3880 RepID=I3T4K7_MEDTR|nr:unknown [Medicago truncatula]